jgi:hypothetical protein
MSKARKLRIGDSAPNLQNGKSFEPYPIGWNKTFKRLRYID